MRKNGLKKAVSLLCVSSLLLGDMNLGSIDFNLIARAETLIDELSTESRSTAVEINETNFPDENFRNYVKNNFDRDGDGKLSESEIQAVTEIDVYGRNIASLEGIQFFSSLTKLDCGWNNLSELDVSSLANLTNLDCGWNNLSELDVSNLTNLTGLSCDGNNLSELDVSNLTNLTDLGCGWNNLSELDVSSLANLTYLYCGWNNLSELDVSNLTNLTDLSCGGNNLSELDVSNLTNLTGLNCDGNNLSELDVSNLTNLTDLSCGGNNLSELDVSGLTELWYLCCEENNLSELDVSSLANLTDLYCDGNNLSELDVSGLPNLGTLSCRGIKLSELDVSGLTGLRLLDCGGNNLSELDVSDLTNLETLNCSWNNLSELDVSSLANLTKLNCSWNNLSELDVSSLANLTYLNCDWNNLSELDVSSLANLTDLYCDLNNLSELDVSGLPNLGTLSCRGNKLSELDVSSLANLTYLYCNENNLSELDVSSLANLTYLDCPWNNLSELDVSGLANLTYLCCGWNNLSELDVSGLPNLTYLGCGWNNLSELDVSGLTGLRNLDCGENNLSELDVSVLPYLTNLSCCSNNLYALTVSEEFNGTVNVDDCGYCINNENGTKDISVDSLPGLDTSRISNLKGGTLQDGILHFDDYQVSYDYDIGNGQTYNFTLYLLNASHDGFSMKLENGDTLRISGQSDFNTSDFKYLEKTNLPIHSVILEEGITAFQHGSESSEFFENCKSIYFPASCTDISMKDMENLESITVAPENPNYMVADGVLYTKDQAELVYVPCNRTELNIPESVTRIGAYACYYNIAMEKIVIPANVEVMEAHSISSEISVEFAVGSRLKKLGDIFSRPADLSILKNTPELEDIEFQNGTIEDLSVLKELPNLKKVSGIYQTYETQEFFTENVEYQLTFELGESIGSTYSSDMYKVKNDSGKVPIISSVIDVSNIKSSLFNEEGIACKTGSETVLCDTYIDLLKEGTNEFQGKAKVPLVIRVVDVDNGVDVTYEDGTPLPNDTDLIVEDVTTEESYDLYRKAAEQLGDLAQLFDITMTSNGVTVQPDGKLKVSIPLPEGMDEASAKVYHIDETGTATDMNAVYENGKLTFVTDHFSVYAVVSDDGMKGDVNQDGKIDMLDYTLLRRAIANWDVEIDENNADVDGDGKLTLVDSTMIRRYIAGWDIEFK